MLSVTEIPTTLRFGPEPVDTEWRIWKTRRNKGRHKAEAVGYRKVEEAEVKDGDNVEIEVRPFGVVGVFSGVFRQLNYRTFLIGDRIFHFKNLNKIRLYSYD
ncbi:MAG: hypothetical protein V4449_03195 [Patescibacteria group bacterium]